MLGFSLYGLTARAYRVHVPTAFASAWVQRGPFLQYRLDREKQPSSLLLLFAENDFLVATPRLDFWQTTNGRTVHSVPV